MKLKKKKRKRNLLVTGISASALDFMTERKAKKNEDVEIIKSAIVTAS